MILRIPAALGWRWRLQESSYHAVFALQPGGFAVARRQRAMLRRFLRKTQRLAALCEPEVHEGIARYPGTVQRRAQRLGSASAALRLSLLSQ